MRILRQLSEAHGVSGAEGPVRDAVLALIKRHVDEVSTDSIGNILAVKHGTGSERLRVMVDAHMDEVGLMVTGHTGDGMLRVAAIGGLDDRLLLGMRVLVGPKALPGVLGGTPVHLASGSSVVSLKEMRVDIGAASKDSASSKAPIGTRIAFDTQFMDLGTLVRGRAFDDRVGCAVLVHLLRSGPYPHDLIASFTVQEEVGLRGAKVAANAAAPDLAFVLEGTIADDLPKEADESPTTVLGKGPALSLMDRSTIFDRRLTRYLIDTAEAEGIAVQFKQPGIGGTNAGSISTAGVGVPTAALSVPCRYIHSPAALLNKGDYRAAIRLMAAALEQLDRAVLQR